MAGRRARHDGWTTARRVAFLGELARGGCVAKAARAADIAPRSAYRLRARPGEGEFAELWDLALTASGAPQPKN